MDYPRVTEILKPFTSYDKVPQEILKNAAIRGTRVHSICEKLSEGAWIPESMIEEDYRGYVRSFQAWNNEQVSGYVLREKRYYCDTHEFTGKLDFVVIGKDGRNYLVDLKTSAAPQKSYPIQMAAYDYLLRVNGVKIQAAMIVYVNKSGEFPDIDFIEREELDKHFVIFTSALRCYNYFHPRKKNGRKKLATDDLSTHLESDE